MISASMSSAPLQVLQARVWNKVTIEKKNIEFRGRVALEMAASDIKDKVAGLMASGEDADAVDHRDTIDEHFYFNVVSAGGYLSANFGWQDDIGYYFLHGTAPHTIEAAPGSALAFTSKTGDNVVVQSVDHPGTEPRLPEVREAIAIALAESIYKHVYLRS